MVGGADTDFGQFSCKNISIVNGAQTVSTLGKFGERNEENLKKVFVPVRIISVKNIEEDLGQKITKTNNRQNRVENRDFVVFDPEQTRLKDELALDGFTYYISRAETNIKSEKSFDLVEATIALACASDDINIVVQLKREIGKLWDNLEKYPYKKLFNPRVHGSYVINCVKVNRMIDRQIDILSQAFLDNKNQSIIIHGNRVLAMHAFKRINNKHLEDPKYIVEDQISETQIKLYLDEIYTRMKFQIETNYTNSVLPTLFKNASKCQAISNQLLIPTPEGYSITSGSKPSYLLIDDTEDIG
jgi:hypothetical protein